MFDSYCQLQVMMRLQFIKSLSLLQVACRTTFEIMSFKETFKLM